MYFVFVPASRAQEEDRWGFQ